MSRVAKPLDACTDTCILINLAIVSRLDLLVQLPDVTFYAPQEVLDEITVPEQRRQAESEIAGGRLQYAENGRLRQMRQRIDD
jgi:hypothetical protein